MPRVALLLFLSIPVLTTTVLGQNNETAFRERAFRLHMAERLLTDRVAKPGEASTFDAIQLWEFQKNIEAFQVQGRELSTFLFLKEWDSSNRRAVAGGAEELEKVVDDLVAYLGKSIDNGAAAQEAVVSFPNLLGQLSRDVVRILPRLERVVENAQRNLIDARMQGEILEDFGTVKHLCRLLQD